MSEYEREAYRPAPGSLWVWEPDRPWARAIIEVIRCHWNGEQWWVHTRALAQYDLHPEQRGGDWNELDRFWEAARSLVHGSKRTRTGPPRPDEMADLT